MKFTTVFILLLLLSGCVSPQAIPEQQTSWDIPVELQVLQATQQAQQTQAVLDGSVAWATQQVQFTQQSQQQEVEQIQATQAALDIKLQQTRGAYEMEQLNAQVTVAAYNQEIAMQSTQISQQSSSTAAAIQINERIQASQRDQLQADFYANVLPATIIGLLGLVAFVIVFGVREYFQVRMRILEQRNRRNLVVETSFGPAVVDVDEAGFLIVELLQPPNQKMLPTPSPRMSPRSAPSTNVWNITPSGSVVASSVSKDRHEMVNSLERFRLVRDLLRNASNIVGPTAKQIPSWRTMQWTSEKWQKAVGILRDLNLVYTIERVGTFIRDEHYPHIGALSAAVHAREIDLHSPTPQEAVKVV